MTSPMAGWLVALSTLALAPETAAPATPEEASLSGTVVALTEALKSTRLTADAGPSAGQVVRRGRDGTIVPLHSDEASRARFQDQRLRNRPIKIRARRHPEIPYLQVISFKVEEHGRWRTPEYYRGIYAISLRGPQLCPCRQGPMVLRMKPEDR
jgi:hypothetical protein